MHSIPEELWTCGILPAKDIQCMHHTYQSKALSLIFLFPLLAPRPPFPQICAAQRLLAIKFEKMDSASSFFRDLAYSPSVVHHTKQELSADLKVGTPPTQSFKILMIE